MLAPYTVKHDYGATGNHPGSSIILLRKINDQNTYEVKVRLSGGNYREESEFFMHFRANDDAAQLAEGLKAALDQTNSKKVKLTFIPRIGSQQLQSPLGN